MKLAPIPPCVFVLVRYPGYAFQLKKSTFTGAFFNCVEAQGMPAHTVFRSVYQPGTWGDGRKDVGYIAVGELSE